MVGKWQGCGRNAIAEWWGGERVMVGIYISVEVIEVW